MGVLRGQILRHPSQNCLVLADALWDFENKIRFVSLIQPFPSRIYRSTGLRKPTRFTLKAAAMLMILASLASIWSAALATQNAHGPKVLVEIPKQLFYIPKELGDLREKANLALDKNRAEEPLSLN